MSALALILRPELREKSVRVIALELGLVKSKTSAGWEQSFGEKRIGVMPGAYEGFGVDHGVAAEYVEIVGYTDVRYEDDSG